MLSMYLGDGSYMKISMVKIVRALSISLDLSQMSTDTSMPIIENISNIDYSKDNFIHHAQRTTYMALEIAKLLNLDEYTKKQLYISSLLHDIGATNHFSESHKSKSFIIDHCQVGARILKSPIIFKDMPNIILYHHENYNGSGPMKLKGKDIPIESQIIRISDLIEVLYNKDRPVFNQIKEITSWVTQNESIIFSPSIVDAFLKASSNDTFWFNIASVNYIDFILDKVSPSMDIYLTLNQFEAIANIFSGIIDTKSKFTASHSMGVSKLVCKISKFLGYSDTKYLQMKIAALLHDIGKLAIPSKILDKKGSLTDDEFAIIKSHVYYTKLILDRIEGIGDISDWAANHHEKLNGKGYPRALDSSQISEESRIMAICDIYQALTEDRPYRNGLDPEKAFSIMNNMASNGLICSKTLQYLKSSLDFESKSSNLL